MGFVVQFMNSRWAPTEGKLLGRSIRLLLLYNFKRKDRENNWLVSDSTTDKRKHGQSECKSPDWERRANVPPWEPVGNQRKWPKPHCVMPNAPASLGKKSGLQIRCSIVEPEVFWSSFYSLNNIYIIKLAEMSPKHQENSSLESETQIRQRKCHTRISKCDHTLPSWMRATLGLVIKTECLSISLSI